MPSFNTEVSHQLGQQQATEKLQSFLEKVRERYKEFVTDYQGNWSDNLLDFSLTAYGLKIDGRLTVEDESAHIAGSLPLAALPFRGKIEQTIGEELRRELS
jgi:hypothetical protein